MMNLSTLLIGKNMLVGSGESDIFQVGTFDGGNAAWSAIVADFDYDDAKHKFHYYVTRTNSGVTSYYSGFDHMADDIAGGFHVESGGYKRRAPRALLRRAPANDLAWKDSA